jgi:hypothetical protein
MLSDGGSETVVVEIVLSRELVGRPDDELEMGGRDAEREEGGSDELFVVLSTMGHKLEGSLHVVEEGMYVCGREGDESGDGGRDEDQVDGTLVRNSRAAHLQAVQ